MPLLAKAQYLRVYDVDYSNYPKLNAKFIFIDNKGKQVVDIKKDELAIQQKNQNTKIVSIINPEEEKSSKISVVFAIDISGSMSGQNIIMAKAATKSFIDITPLELSEAAVSTYNSNSYVNIDFHQNKGKLKQKIDAISANGGTSYDAGFSSQLTGALNLAKEGRYKRIIIFLTDGFGSANQSEVIEQANDNGITVYSITLGVQMPMVLKNISGQTGGLFYENVMNIADAKKFYKQILIHAQNSLNGEINWEAIECQIADSIDVRIRNTNTRIPFDVPEVYQTQFQLTPKKYLFEDKKTKKNIKLKALNGDIEIQDITNTNTHLFQLNHSLQFPYTLKKNAEIEFEVAYTPEDNGMVFSRITIKGKPCAEKYIYIAGGEEGVPTNSKLEQSLKVIKPNGGEVFIPGILTNIECTGLGADDNVIIDVTTNNGKNWHNGIKYSGTSYNWKVINEISDSCKIRVKHSIKTEVKRIQTLENHSSYVTYAAFSPDNKLIITTSKDNTAIIWDALTYELLHTLDSHTEAIHGAVFTKDSKFVVTYSADNTMVIWDATTGEEIHSLDEHDEPVVSVQISDDNRYLISGSEDNTAKIWDFVSGEMFFSLDYHTKKVNKAMLFPQSATALTMSDDNQLILWNVLNGTVQSIQKNTKDVDISNDGSKIAIVSTDGKIQVLNQKAGGLVYVLDTENHKAINIEFSQNAEYILAITDANIVYVWQAYSGKLLQKLKHDYPIKAAAFSPNNRFVITDNRNVWDTKTGMKIFSITGHKGSINSAVFSSDSKQLITASNDRTAVLWSTSANNFVIQSDASDHVFRIISPKPDVTHIQMPRIVLGTSTDLLIPDFIKNNNKYPVQIEKIEVTGRHASDFKLISGFPPYTIKPKGISRIEFRFSPKNIGERTALINVITPTDTIQAIIAGRAIEKKCYINNSMLNFGVLYPGEKKDSSISVLSNIMKTELIIDSIVLAGPDKLQFELKSDNKKRILKAGVALSLKFSYTALRRGSASSVCKIYVSGYTFPVTTELYAKCYAPRSLILSGAITNINTGNNIGGKLKCFDMLSGRLLHEFNLQTGDEYKIELNVDRKYILTAEKNGFLTTTENIDLSGLIIEKEMKRNIALTKIQQGAKLRLNNLFFEFAKATLLEESTIELDNLYKMMKQNPAFDIEIGGHTDNVGSNSANLSLSQKRANAVRQYLIDKGIKAERLKAKGYGETQPEATNDTPEGRQKNRRVEVKLIRI